MAGTGEKSEYYRLGDYVDAMDSSQKWLAAMVLQSDPAKGVLVRFDGWSTKWNEWLSLRSSRLAPFRRYSHLYGGQQSAALRDWTYTEEELHSYQQLLTAAIQGDYTGFATPYDVTQFFRGHLFTLIDNLLSHSLPVSSLPPVLSLLTSFLHFSLLYLSRLPTQYSHLYHALSHPDSYLTDKDIALAQIWPELFCSVERVLGADVRLLELLSGPMGEETININQDLPENIGEFPLLSRLLTVFIDLNGFQAISSLLSDTK